MITLNVRMVDNRNRSTYRRSHNYINFCQVHREAALRGGVRQGRRVEGEVDIFCGDNGYLQTSTYDSCPYCMMASLINAYEIHSSYDPRRSGGLYVPEAPINPQRLYEALLTGRPQLIDNAMFSFGSFHAGYGLISEGRSKRRGLVVITTLRTIPVVAAALWRGSICPGCNMPVVKNHNAVAITYNNNVRQARGVLCRSCSAKAVKYYADILAKVGEAFDLQGE